MKQRKKRSERKGWWVVGVGRRVKWNGMANERGTNEVRVMEVERTVG